MPNVIQHKRNSIAGTVPSTGSLSQGELGINTADGRLFTKNSNNVIINLGVSSISGTLITPASGNFSSSLQLNNVAVSVSGHSHTSSNISDFNASVSGLLTPYVLSSRTITINGTTNQITSSAGAQDLSANRTWTLSLPQDIHTGASPTFASITINGTANARAAASASAATQIPVFNADPASTTRAIVTRTPAQLLGDIGAAATNQTMFIGTTSVAINRASASQTLTGVSIDGNAATVTSGVYTSRTINTTSPLSGGGNLSADRTIALSAAYGDTLNPYGSKTANHFLSAPNGSAGVPTFRAIVAADVPTLNQNTTGSAATLTTARTLWGQSFNGSANVNGNMSSVGDITGTAALNLTATGGTLGLISTGANIIAMSTNGSERLRVDSTGNVGIGTTSPTYKLHVNGSFGATTKSFRIDHPSKEGYSLEYGSLESPYHGVRLTGRGKIIRGTGVVVLPDYLKDLIYDDESLTIQLTNYKHNKTLYIDSIDLQNDIFVVKADRAKTLEELLFFWSLTGTRKDVDSLIVEKKK